MLEKYVMVYLFCNAALNSGVIADAPESDDDFRKTLLAGYDKSLHPVLFGRYIARMYFLFFRTRGLDEKKGEFITEGAIAMEWTDERLEKALDKNEVTKIPLSTEDIWVPSIYVVNSIEKEEVTLKDTALLIANKVVWVPRYTFRTACNPNLKYFPFDTQVCEILIAFSTIEGEYLSFNITDKVNMYFTAHEPTYMIENPQWNLQKIEFERRNIKVDSDTIREVFIHKFIIKRSMPLIPLAILTPCICCILLLLTTFWMQVGKNLRSGINAASMLVSSSSLFTLGKILPASGSSTPAIVEYVSITLIISAISSIQTMLTSIILRCEKRPPISYGTIISKIPTFCHRLLGISTEQSINIQLEEKFLFSDLNDSETRNVSEAEGPPRSNPANQSLESVQSLWKKYIILWDRLMFYLLGVIILLFIVSVIITE